MRIFLLELVLGTTKILFWFIKLNIYFWLPFFPICDSFIQLLRCRSWTNSGMKFFSWWNIKVCTVQVNDLCCPLHTLSHMYYSSHDLPIWFWKLTRQLLISLVRVSPPCAGKFADVLLWSIVEILFPINHVYFDVENMVGCQAVTNYSISL